MHEKPGKPLQFGLKWLFVAPVAVGLLAVLPRSVVQIVLLLLALTLAWTIPFWLMLLAERAAEIDLAWLSRRWWRR